MLRRAPSNRESTLRLSNTFKVKRRLNTAWAAFADVPSVAQAAFRTRRLRASAKCSDAARSQSR